MMNQQAVSIKVPKHIHLAIKVEATRSRVTMNYEINRLLGIAISEIGKDRYMGGKKGRG